MPGRSSNSRIHSSPDTTRKLARGILSFAENADPVALRQRLQWQYRASPSVPETSYLTLPQRHAPSFMVSPNFLLDGRPCLITVPCWITGCRSLITMPRLITWDCHIVVM